MPSIFISHGSVDVIALDTFDIFHRRGAVTRGKSLLYKYCNGADRMVNRRAPRIFRLLSRHALATSQRTAELGQVASRRLSSCNCQMSTHSTSANDRKQPAEATRVQRWRGDFRVVTETFFQRDIPKTFRPHGQGSWGKPPLETADLTWPGKLHEAPARQTRWWGWIYKRLELHFLGSLDDRWFCAGHPYFGSALATLGTYFIQNINNINSRPYLFVDGWIFKSFRLIAH